MNDIPVEFPGFIQPLLSSLFFLTMWEGCPHHHLCQMLGYSLLEGVNEDFVSGDTTSGSLKPECSSIVVEVSKKVLSHGEGIKGLSGPICNVLGYEG